MLLYADKKLVWYPDGDNNLWTGDVPGEPTLAENICRASVCSKPDLCTTWAASVHYKKKTNKWLMDLNIDNIQRQYSSSFERDPKAAWHFL